MSGLRWGLIIGPKWPIQGGARLDHCGDTMNRDTRGSYLEVFLSSGLERGHQGGHEAHCLLQWLAEICVDQVCPEALLN